MSYGEVITPECVFGTCFPLSYVTLSETAGKRHAGRKTKGSLTYARHVGLLSLLLVCFFLFLFVLLLRFSFLS